MKILHVVCSYPTKDRPFEQPFTKAQIDSLEEAGIDIKVYDIRGYESIFNYLKAIPNIRKFVQKNKIDLIHSHYSYAALASYLGFTRKPIVLSLMGSDLLGVPDKDGNLKLRGKIDILLTSFISKKVKHIIVKSEAMKNKVNSKVNIDVIPNGVNFDQFEPKDRIVCRNELGLDKDAFYILFLGNPKNLRKNIILANNSFNRFAKVYSKAKLLTPYGSSSSEVNKYMNASNVLLLTSYWEGSPNVIKEAMACNLPIISTDVGDVNEVIKETNNCFVVPYSEEIIAEKLESIINNNQKTNGREKVSHLRSDKIANKVISIYQKLLLI